MRFRNGFTGEAMGTHPYSVLTLPSTACALGLSFSRGWDARWRTGKSQIHPKAIAGQDSDRGTDPAMVLHIPVDSLAERTLPRNSTPL